MIEKSGMEESRYNEIERAQDGLRTSIEQSKALAADSDRLLARRRDNDAAPAAPTESAA